MCDSSIKNGLCFSILRKNDYFWVKHGVCLNAVAIIITLIVAPGSENTTLVFPIRGTPTDTICIDRIAYTNLSLKCLTAYFKMFIIFDPLNEMLRNFVEMLHIEHYLCPQICRTIETKL